MQSRRQRTNKEGKKAKEKWQANLYLMKKYENNRSDKEINNINLYNYLLFQL